MSIMSTRRLAVLVLVALLQLVALTPSASAEIAVPIGTPSADAFQWHHNFYTDDSATPSSDPTVAYGLNYTFYWSVENPNTNNQTLHGLIQLQGQNMKWAWAGIGFGRSMLDAQFIVCHQESSPQYAATGEVEMHEHTTLFKYAPPTQDFGVQIAVPVQGISQNNALMCEFRRPLTPIDSYHTDLSAPMNNMIWAFNPRSGLNPSGLWFTYHEADHRGALEVGLAQGYMFPIDAKSFTKKQVHGFGMMAVWLVLLPFGAFWARYLRSTAHWNMLHLTTQSLGVLGMLIFFIIILTDWINLSRPHAIFGLVLLSFIVVQFVLGVCSLLGLSHQRLNDIRKYVRRAHNTQGFTLLLASVAQVGLGLDTIYPWVEPRGKGAWAVYIGLVAFWLMLFAATEVYFRKSVARDPIKPERYVHPAPGKRGAGNSVAMQKVGHGRSVTTLVDSNATAIPMPNTRLRPELQMYTWDSLNQAIMDGGLFVVANGRYVYAIDEWMTSHPGGQLILHAVNGSDITNDYFRESGYDVEEFVPKRAAPAQVAGRNHGTLPRAPSTRSVSPSEGRAPSSTYGNNSILQELKLAPLMDERDWKLVVRSRRTHVHTRLAIQKLSNLLVGELVPDSNSVSGSANSPAAAEELSPLRDFDPHEYRRYALVENTPLTPLAPIVKFRFCLLYPYDLRANEPEVIYPGQSIEICARINNKLVTRYYCPSGHIGGLSMLEILVKIYPHGAMSQYLFKQKPGQRQVKIRGPFGQPLVSPSRPLSMSVADFIPKHIVFVAGGTGITPFLQLLLLALLPVAEPLRVHADYAAQMEDELTLRRGDRVAVKSHYFDGWAVGVNLRSQQEGAFPVTVTAPRVGIHARITLVHCVKTAGETVMGGEWLEGALLAYPGVLEVHRFIADGTVPEVPLGVTHRAAITDVDLDDIVRRRFGTDDDAEEQQHDNESEDEDVVVKQSRHLYVCGPPGFDSWCVDAVTEIGIDMRNMTILPSDRVL
ncbi:hypothetical protein HDU87_001658 [Geranomyces variabilis]|uniref:Cytochrome b5 heme-binding domain-containing protein n=1 Tax=Geranomyces variabilis TaxID=109894 RepID=A0AAD5TPT2_9FUNG|nr:hypothetical protein HDU87_001658 [Geranomyces variabilis]